MWSDECIVEFQGCFRFAKILLQRLDIMLAYLIVPSKIIEHVMGPMVIMEELLISMVATSQFLTATPSTTQPVEEEEGLYILHLVDTMLYTSTTSVRGKSINNKENSC